MKTTDGFASVSQRHRRAFPHRLSLRWINKIIEAVTSIWASPRKQFVKNRNTAEAKRRPLEIVIITNHACGLSSLAERSISLNYAIVGLGKFSEKSEKWRFSRHQSLQNSMSARSPKIDLSVVYFRKIATSCAHDQIRRKYQESHFFSRRWTDLAKRNICF